MPVMKSRGTLLVCTLLILISGTAGRGLGLAAEPDEPQIGLADSPWPMFQHDSQHTGRSIFSGPDVPDELWRFETGGTIHSSPVIGPDGSVYFGSTDNRFYAVNPDGTEKWSVGTNGSVDGSAAVASDGTVYFGSGDGKLYAVDANGREKWSFQTGISGSPAIADDGTIYFASHGGLCPTCDGTLYALQPDGTVRWTAELEPRGSPAVGSDGTVYVSSHVRSKLYAINPDGSIKWDFEDSILTTPSIRGDGTTFIGGDDFHPWTDEGNFVAVHPSGAELWDFKPDDGSEGAIFSGPAIDREGGVYFGATDESFPEDSGSLFALDQDGFKKWHFNTGGDVASSPAVDADGDIYFGSTDGKLYALNPDGTEKWSFQTGDSIWSASAIGEDRVVYVTSGDGNLYAIQERPVTPTAQFTASPATGETPLTVQFTDESSDWPDTWESDFDLDSDSDGDGDPANDVDSTEQHPSHTYTASGVYSVKLTVSNEAGNDSQTRENLITATLPDVFAVPNAQHHRDSTDYSGSASWDGPGEGATGLVVGIQELVRSDGDEPGISLGPYIAELDYDPSCTNVLEVRDGPDGSISHRDIDNEAGVTTIHGMMGGLSGPDLILAFPVLRLTGDADATCDVNFSFGDLRDMDGNPIAFDPGTITVRVRRGDIRQDGSVDIADALFGAQYLADLRDGCVAPATPGSEPDLDCANPVGMASVRQDGEFDEASIADVLFIAQYLADLRDDRFKPR